MAASTAPFLRFWRWRSLPLQLQTEAAECGLACLAMVASYWGHRIDVAALRRRFAVSLKGVTLRGLIVMAQQLQLQGRPLKLDLQHLPRLALPCILHWDMNHFVVLHSVGRRHVVIHDPALGVRRVQMAEVSRHFTGIALELAPAAGFRPIADAPRWTMRALMGRVVGLRRGLAQLLLLGVALQLCLLLAPFYLQWTIDEALVSADRDLVTVLGIGFLLLIVFQAALGALRGWATTVLTTSLHFQWLGNVFAHLMRLPLPYFEKRHLGDIVSRFGCVQTIQRSLTTQLVEGVIDGLLVVATLAVMVLYSTGLAALACAAVALYGLLRALLFGAARQAQAEQIAHAARQQTHFLESARGVQSVRLFGKAEDRRIAWLDRLTEQFNAELRIARLAVSQQSAQTLLFGMERIAIVWLGALAVLDARLSVGMLIAFLSYKDQFTQRAAALVDRLAELRMLRLHAERVADIVLTEPEPDDGPVAIDLAALAPTIEFRGVGFRYADGEPFVLQGLDIAIPRGQCVAVTGPSGCGKTTLLKLLLGLLEPTEGQVLIGGVPLPRLGRSAARRVIGAVMQEDHLFVGSIADNIGFFDPSARGEHVQACAQLAAIHDEIAAMPMGYDTLVGDVGTGLSGGQRQRILLARALFKRPRILLLDEATSHLDLANEQRVNAAVLRIPLTRVVVAHRPETIAMAQRVIVIERGRVASDRLRSPAMPTPAVGGTAEASRTPDVRPRPVPDG